MKNDKFYTRLTDIEKELGHYIVEDINNDVKIDLNDAIKIPLQGDGDFKSEECIEILKKAT